MKKKTVAPGNPLDDDDDELSLLSLISREDIEDAQVISRQRMGPLGAALLVAGLDTRYRWQPAAGGVGRYVDSRTGRAISNKALRDELDDYIDESRAEVVRQSEQLRARGIPIAAWQLAMRREIKRTALVTAALGLGGWAAMTAADYGRAGLFVAGQYKFLRGFAEQIAERIQRLDGTLRARAGAYIQAGRNFYYQLQHEKLGPEYQLVRSIRHAEDSCDDCIRLDGVWFELGDPDYLLPGDRECRWNCKCSEEYGTIRTGGDEEIVLESA